MSKEIKIVKEKITVPKIQKMAKVGDKITMLTAYDCTMARMIDDAGIEIVLVGDSLGMVVQGHSSTLPVSIEDMIYHTACVAQGITSAHLMTDMPFLSYQASYDEAVTNAGNLLKAGAESVKLEGGEEIADLVWYLNKIGIPVMAHIGLKPQTIHTMGGYRTQGKNKKDAEMIFDDAKILEEAGAFALLLEGIPVEVAQKITEQAKIPTIGIGSGPFCSGQVLVCYDLLGANPNFKPRFVKKYADLYGTSQKAFKEYIQEVKDGSFPSDDHSTHQNLTVIDEDSKACFDQSKNVF